MTDVLICGSGPAGMTLAIELLRRGIQPRLVDAAAAPFAGSRGKGLQPRTLEILDMMDVIDRILPHADFYPPIRVHLGPLAFTRPALGTRAAPSEDRPHPNLLMLPQSRTEAALADRIAELGGRIEYGSGVESFVQDENGVTAVLSTGERVRAAFLVGCDGGRSTVRKALALTLKGRSLDERTMIVADLQIEGLDRAFWHAWPLHRGGVRSLAPLPQTDLFQLQAPLAIARHGLEAGIRYTTGRDLARIAWQSQFHHQSRMVETYRVGRALLAGDAAHVHPPSGGQGLNTGIQDAFNLGWKLAAVLKGADGMLLDSYEAERLPVAAAMLDLTAMLHTTRSTARGALTDQLSVGYRGGPLAEDATGDTLQPGDRMPDRRLSDGRRLFEILREGAPVQVATGESGPVLVRPDGYVARVGGSWARTYHDMRVIDVEAAPTTAPRQTRRAA